MGKRSLGAARYILSKADRPITPMMLLKLVYIAHGYSLALNKTPLLDEEVLAWQYGPIVRSVYDGVRDFRSMPVRYIKGAVGTFVFSHEDMEVMDRVLETYSEATAIALSSAMHRTGTPWSITREIAGGDAPISNDLIKSFYRDLLAQPSHSAL